MVRAKLLEIVILNVSQNVVYLNWLEQPFSVSCRRKQTFIRFIALIGANTPNHFTSTDCLFVLSNNIRLDYNEIRSISDQIQSTIFGFIFVFIIIIYRSTVYKTEIEPTFKHNCILQLEQPHARQIILLIHRKKKPLNTYVFFSSPICPGIK